MKHLIAALIIVSTSAFATPSPMKDVSTKDLLVSYWKCMDVDAEANKKGERMDEGALNGCSLVSKELQVRHFGDDFGRLHAWTLKNKAARPEKM